MEILIKIENSNNQQVKQINLEFYENGEMKTNPVNNLPPVNHLPHTEEKVSTGRNYDNINTISNFSTLENTPIEKPDTSIGDRGLAISSEMTESF